MYNASLLQTEFSGLVGWFQPYDPQYQGLPASLTASSSGRYIQKTHPICSLENLYNIAPEFGKFTYPAWSGAAAYPATSIVTDGGKIYWASVNIPVGYAQPGTGPASVNWIEVNMFAEWLQDVYRGAVIDLVAELIKQKKLAGANRTLVDSLHLFDGLGSLNDRIIKSGRFLGFQIEVSRQDGLQVNIDKMGLQLDNAAGDIPMYLYHSSVDEPLKTWVLNVDKALTFNWKRVQDVILKFYEDSHDTDGVFYLGYYENDLPDVTQAIKRTSNWGKPPCLGCSDFNVQSFNTWSQYVSIQAICIDAADVNYDSKTIWPGQKVKFDNSSNWGLNLALSVYCDMTDMFIRNKELFAEGLARQVCVKLLAEIAYSTRMTAISDKTRALAMADLDPSQASSFMSVYLKDLEALSLDFSGLSSACLPCVKKPGIRMGAV